MLIEDSDPPGEAATSYGLRLVEKLYPSDSTYDNQRAAGGADRGRLPLRRFLPLWIENHLIVVPIIQTIATGRDGEPAPCRFGRWSFFALYAQIVSPVSRE